MSGIFFHYIQPVVKWCKKISAEIYADNTSAFSRYFSFKKGGLL